MIRMIGASISGLETIYLFDRNTSKRNLMTVVVVFVGVDVSVPAASDDFVDPLLLPVALLLLS
jgi:hypothetical protein